MYDLDLLIKGLEEQYESSHKHSRFNLEKIPYVSFIKWYQNNKSYSGWKALIEDVDSPFMKLMQIDSLFFQIDSISEEKKSVKQIASPKSEKGKGNKPTFGPKKNNPEQVT